MNLEQTIHGHAEVLLDRKKTRAIFGDALCNDIPKINALMSAHDLGIIKVIEENYPVNTVQRSNFINKMVNHYSMNPNAAQWSVDTWIQIMSEDVISEMHVAIAEKEQEKAEESNSSSEILDNSSDSSFEPVPVSRDELTVKSELIDYFVNVKLEKVYGKILIPCGVGTTDYGFYICGIKELKISHAPSSFALVYNYLIRNSTILEEDYPHYLNRIRTTYQINYQRVYRLMIIILQLIKNGNFPYGMNIRYDGSRSELQLAVDILNDYHSLFCRLMGVQSQNIIIDNKSGSQIFVSLDSTGKGVWVENNTKPVNARELWFGTKINYRLSQKNQPDLEYILSEISPFDSFKEGQFPALTSMLNSSGNAMCIMPTGSGKSLIYYFASLLQPLPMMIIAPTDILIDDQIRNLGKFHHIDNVSHLELTATNDFRDFRPCNSLMYITPMTFQSRHLLVKCRHLNDENETLAYVVLDEIHCLSNWGHDFRPEYLMLSQFLKKYLSRISLLGFTATANYTVVEDIQKQLDISQSNIFSPIQYEKYNIAYHFTPVQSEEDMFMKTCDIVAKLIEREERTLIFTKDENISCKLAEAIGYEADVFQKNNTSGYHLFADEKCNVLVASEDLGIGINLPNVKNIIHYGLPVSKNEFVQELGRAGRADEAVSSYVIYLAPNEQNVPARLLMREELPSELAPIIGGIQNDYKDCFLKLNNGVLSKNQLLDQVLSLYHELDSANRALVVGTYDLASVDDTKRLIYMLYLTGYVNDWYAYSGNENKGSVDILMDISSTDHYRYENSMVMLNRMKERSVSYYDTMQGNRKQIVLTQRAGEIEEIIGVYVDWYYSKFLYHHKEQFLDLLDFVEGNVGNDSEKITEDIQEYFTLPFSEVKSDESYYQKLSIAEIGKKVSQGIGRKTLVNIERINSNQYSLNLDCLIFLGTMKIRSTFDKNRFDRIMKRVDNEQRYELKEAFVSVYPTLTVSAKIGFIYAIIDYPQLFGDTHEAVCNSIYANSEKDFVFYGLMARSMNKLFAKGERV